GDTSSEEVASAAMTAAFDQIDELARWLFQKADSTNVWSAVDEQTRLYWRKEAVRRLTAIVQPRPGQTALNLPDRADGDPKRLR
ncbi:hypothetical protein, partial [Mesorhizobium sp. M2D.F.Ca.ET.223.01.1.1]|uniref:hypothetical protein n=1 Tax=Mesorhizobium sp. M2D.F.Ca.ET.223.01.1.1 TaxID=2563940 RepID=UPI001AEF35CE